MSMDKINYLLKYLSELQVQAHELIALDDVNAVKVTWARITKVNDLIETELAKY
jgi:hypothetical protein